jgi:hypothetical protein
MAQLKKALREKRTIIFIDSHCCRQPVSSISKASGTRSSASDDPPNNSGPRHFELFSDQLDRFHCANQHYISGRAAANLTVLPCLFIESAGALRDRAP